MNFSTIKDKIPSLNISKAPLVLTKSCNKYLLQGLTATTVIYIALFSYIYAVSESTLNTIKNTSPSKTVPIVFSSKTLKETHDSKTQKEDADIKDLIIDGLYQKTAQGLLPTIRRSDNLTSFRAYQHPFDLKNIPHDKPIITFVILNVDCDFWISHSYLILLTLNYKKLLRLPNFLWKNFHLPIFVLILV